MDREVVKKMLNQFTVGMDMRNPNDLVNAEKANRQIMELLKPLFDAGKAFRQVSRNERTGQQSYTYAFPGSKSVSSNIQAGVHDILSELGMADTPPSFRRASYTQIQDRILDQHASAAVQARAVRMGGMARTDRGTGITNLLVPSKYAQQMIGEIDTGDTRYMSGLSSAVMGYSSAATPYEKAYGMTARKERMIAATRQARTDFITANPNSEIAKQAAAEEEKKRKEEKDGDKRLVQGALSGFLHTIVGLLATSGITLKQILGGILEMANSTTKDYVNTARLNMTSKQIDQYKAASRAMGFANGDNDQFTDMIGYTLNNYTNPQQIGEKIKNLGIFYQGASADIAGYINGENISPKDFAMRMLANSLNISMSGRGGPFSKATAEDANTYNTPYVAQGIGKEGADLYSRITLKLQEQGKFNSSTSFTGSSLDKWIIDTFGVESTLVPGDLDKRSGKETTNELNKLNKDWEGLKDTVFTKMLAHLDTIVNLLRNVLRPVISSFDKSAEVAANREALALNNQYTAEAMTGAKTFLPPGMSMSTAQQAYGLYKNKDMYGLRKLLGNVGADAFSKNAGLIVNLRAMDDLVSARGAGVLGLQGATAIPSSEYSQASRAMAIADMQYSIAAVEIEKNTKMQRDNKFIGGNSAVAGAQNRDKAFATISKLGSGRSSSAGLFSALANMMKDDIGKRVPHQFTGALRDMGFGAEDIKNAMAVLGADKSQFGSLLSKDFDIMLAGIGVGDNVSNSGREMDGMLQKQATVYGKRAEQAEKIRAIVDAKLRGYKTPKGATFDESEIAAGILSLSQKGNNLSFSILLKDSKTGETLTIAGENSDGVMSVLQNGGSSRMTFGDFLSNGAKQVTK